MHEEIKEVLACMKLAKLVAQREKWRAAQLRQACTSVTVAPSDTPGCHGGGDKHQDDKLIALAEADTAAEKAERRYEAINGLVSDIINGMGKMPIHQTILALRYFEEEPWDSVLKYIRMFGVKSGKSKLYYLHDQALGAMEEVYCNGGFKQRFLEWQSM